MPQSSCWCTAVASIPSAPRCARGRSSTPLRRTPMCGITGLCRTAGGAVGDELERMNAQITHRGPDDEGYYRDGGVGLAMRRLSIIDLPGGHQPLANEDDTVWVVFN